MATREAISLVSKHLRAVGYWQAAAGLASLYCFLKAIQFIRADADLRLLSKRHPGKNAFEDKVVWITGASQGLGEELAKAFSAHGAYLILSSRKLERLKAVKAACRGKHAPEIAVLPLDITADYAELERAASSAMESFGSGSSSDAQGIQYLVHNAALSYLLKARHPHGLDSQLPVHSGASQRSPVEEASNDSVESLFELNVAGTLRLTRAVLPMLMKQAQSRKEGCKIVVVGSMASQMPAAGQAVYAACKASIAAYFRTLHSELWNRGITVSLCHPGPMATGVAGQLRSLYGSEGLLTEAEDPSSVKKRQSPKRVAQLILRAAYHGLDSCWICQHPVLLLAYLIQYWPSLGYWILNKIGPARALAYKTGKSGYDVRMLRKRE